MQRVSWAVLFVLILSTFGYAQQQENSNSESAVIATMRAIRAASQAGDKAAWDRLVAANCAFVEPSGSISSRESHQPRTTTGSTGVNNQLELSDFSVRDYGETAILTYREDQTINIDGNVTRAATRYTEAYKHIGESWQMIFSAETPIPLAKVIKVDSKIYDDYVGEYQIAPGLIGTVFRQGEKLMLTGTGWKTPYELLPIAADSFAVKGMEQNQISFLRDKQGKVTHQVSTYRGQQQAVAPKLKH